MKKSFKVILLIVLIVLLFTGLFFIENRFHFSDLLFRRDTVVEDEDYANVIIYLLNFSEKSDAVGIDIKIDYWHNISRTISSRDCTKACITPSPTKTNSLFLNLRKGNHKLIASSSDIDQTVSSDFTINDKVWILVGFNNQKENEKLYIITSEEEFLFD